MISIKAINHIGRELTISNSEYPVVGVEGLTPADAEINTTGAGLADGTFFNSSHLGQRNIVITVIPRGNPEDARLELYRVFLPKRSVRLYLKTNTREVYIDGYTEKIAGNLFDQTQSFQISIICPNPYFKDANTDAVVQSITEGLFTFPVAFPAAGIPLSRISSGQMNISNRGEEATGVLLSIEAQNGRVANPIVYNETTHQRFAVNITLQEGERLDIDTRQGHKTVILNRDGQDINAINTMVRGSDWIELAQGDNIFTLECSDGLSNARIVYDIDILYEGV